MHFTAKLADDIPSDASNIQGCSGIARPLITNVPMHPIRGANPKMAIKNWAREFIHQIHQMRHSQQTQLFCTPH